MSVYMPKINYILLIYRNLFLASIHTSKLLLLNSLMELLGTNTDIHKKELNMPKQWSEWVETKNI
ncbi:hypothetical protein TFUB4_02672 [Tannerella forsythia]|nr:hypothetical protein TFUB4_02672 [Tannerella forsythia]